MPGKTINYTVEELNNIETFEPSTTDELNNFLDNTTAESKLQTLGFDKLEGQAPGYRRPINVTNDDLLANIAPKLGKFSHLTEVNLANCSEVTDVGVLKISQIPGLKTHWLKTVWLSGCNITDMSLYRAGNFEVKKLVLNNNQNITQDGLNGFFEGNTAIESLTMGSFHANMQVYNAKAFEHASIVIPNNFRMI